MQYVRCEACGAKAILAASRCPKCTHPLELRDHHGEFFPLTHCRKCDTWYPTSRGACKWCGTTPGTARPARWAVAVGVGVVLAAAGWWVASLAAPGPDEPAHAEPRVAKAAPPAVAPITVAPGTTADSALGQVDSGAAAGVAGPPPDTAALPTPDLAPAPPVGSVATPRQPPAAFARIGFASTDTYINLRGDADRTAAIIGTIGPGTRVETGARYRGWRQVRTPSGQVGWVDPRHLVDVP